MLPDGLPQEPVPKRKDRHFAQYICGTKVRKPFRSFSSVPNTSTVMPEATVPLDGDLRETLRWTADSLVEIYGYRLRKLILFGSQARGEATRESDVDLLVVLEGSVTSIEEAKRTSRVATDAAAYRDTALSFIHMSTKEFADDRRPIIWKIREDGIDLLELFDERADSPLRFPTSNQ